jgi:hypothetical protein
VSKRFELMEDGHTAYADYRLEGDVLHIQFVFAPEGLRGRGAAGRLMESIVAEARAQSLKIHPICGYAAAWLRKHKEHQNLVI